jgi:hypothetical protein
MAVVIDEVEVQPAPGQRLGEPQQPKAAPPPSPSAETTPAAAAGKTRTLRHLERRAGRVRAH